MNNLQDKANFIWSVATLIRDLHAGDIISADSVSAPLEAWIQIDVDRWCAFSYNGNKFPKKVSV
jgi:hypothetical protein